MLLSVQVAMGSVVQSLAVDITVTSVRSSMECAQTTALYGSALAVSACGQSSSMKLSFSFFQGPGLGSMSQKSHSQERRVHVLVANTAAQTRRTLGRQVNKIP